MFAPWYITRMIKLCISVEHMRGKQLRNAAAPGPRPGIQTHSPFKPINIQEGKRYSQNINVPVKPIPISPLLPRKAGQPAGQGALRGQQVSGMQAKPGWSGAVQQAGAPRGVQQTKNSPPRTAAQRSPARNYSAPARGNDTSRTGHDTSVVENVKRSLFTDGRKESQLRDRSPNRSWSAEQRRSLNRGQVSGRDTSPQRFRDRSPQRPMAAQRNRSPERSMQRSTGAQRNRSPERGSDWSRERGRPRQREQTGSSSRGHRARSLGAELSSATWAGQQVQNEYRKGTGRPRSMERGFDSIDDWEEPNWGDLLPPHMQERTRYSLPYFQSPPVAGTRGGHDPRKYHSMVPDISLLDRGLDRGIDRGSSSSAFRAVDPAGRSRPGDPLGKVLDPLASPDKTFYQHQPHKYWQQYGAESPGIRERSKTISVPRNADFRNMPRPGLTPDRRARTTGDLSSQGTLHSESDVGPYGYPDGVYPSGPYPLQKPNHSTYTVHDMSFQNTRQSQDLRENKAKTYSPAILRRKQPSGGRIKQERPKSLTSPDMLFPSGRRDYSTNKSPGYRSYPGPTFSGMRPSRSLEDLLDAGQPKRSADYQLNRSFQPLFKPDKYKGWSYML